MAGLKSRAEALIELGLSGAVHDEDIRKAFRLRLKQAHPDLNGGTDMRLRRLILARDLLMSGGKSEPEIFEFIHPADVTDVSATPLSIRLQQALFGGTAMAEVSALEFAHANETLISLTQTKILRVTLPCGLRDGEKVRLPCENANDREIFFHIHIEPEADCRVWGNDIWMTAKLENRLLQRGGEAIVDTPHGPQSIKIDRGIPQGASLCLHGKGLPATETAPAGNLYIRLEAGPDVIRPVLHVLSEFRQRWAS